MAQEQSLSSPRAFLRHTPILPLRVDSTRDETLLNPAASMFVDSSGVLTIQDIDHIAERLRPIPGGIVNFGVSEFPFWFCIALANLDSLPLQRLLCAEDYFLETVDTYIFSRHRAMQHLSGGCSIPFSQKTVKNRFTVQPLAIPAHDTLYVFVRVSCRLTMNVPLRLWKEETFVLADSRSQIPVWLYFGVVAGLFVYNLFICITLRSVTYLLYLLYILHISAFFFWGSNGLGFEYFSLSVETSFRLIMYLGIVSMVFVSLLTMRFLELWHGLRAWFIALAVPTLLLFLIALSAWFLPITLVQDIGNPATGAMAILCAVVAIRALGLNFLPARYFAAGWVLFLAATVLFVLQNAGVLESSIIAQYGAQVGSAVEMVMFSMALASRISILEKERNEATANLLHTSQELILTLQESERTLEKKVTERTKNLQDANALLSEQAQKIQIVNSTLQEQNFALEESRAHIERLMLNILPKSITARLQAGEKGIADKHESVTVLFADIVDFTKLSANISPEELVALLDTLFSRFDELVEQHQLEKIKTIGDAYMVVGGLEDSGMNHTTAVALLALDMQAAAAEMASLFDLPQLVLRIGMHTGAVVAGVIGKKKLAYDLWGDTVNTASRMESHGEAGKIHVSEEVYRALRGHSSLGISHWANNNPKVPMTKQPMTNDQVTNGFLFEERGEMEVKGKGMMKTYFLTGTR